MYPRHDSERAVDGVNEQLRVAQEWGARWKVSFVPEKTQVMLVFRSPAAGPAVGGRPRFGGVSFPLQESIKILGGEVDRGLRFECHAKHIAQKASHGVSSRRKMAGFLDRRGRLLLYKAQILPYLDYGALLWMSCSATHTKKLDSIKRGARRLVDTAALPVQPETPSSVNTLEHRRDVAAFVVFHKAQLQGVPHRPGLHALAFQSSH